MEVVEISPPYDHADTTAHLGARVVTDVLATLVDHGHLGSRLTSDQRAHAEHERDRAVRPGSAPLAACPRHRLATLPSG